MTSEDVLKIYNDLMNQGIIVWMDGGWCIDALLGKQTRDHEDLDIAVDRKDNEKLKQVLIDNGYLDLPRNDSTEWMYVMRDKTGKIIDVHVFEYDETGNNIYGIEYPFGSLTGTGTINGKSVKCIAPEWMFKFKTAYTPNEKDLKDVQALSKKFSFKLPSGYNARGINP